jgi:predicted DNA-binding mobile mystery protein A
MDEMNTNALRREQIDRKLRQTKGLANFVEPRRGWITEVRRIIGMRGDQLAARMRVSRSTVGDLERSEELGTISLNTLRRAAAAMECKLIYAFVPHEKSFEDLVRARAEEFARNLANTVGHTMALEDQATSEHAREELIKHYVESIVRQMPRELWDERH